MAMQIGLFQGSPVVTGQEYPMNVLPHDGEALFFGDFLPGARADQVFNELRHTVPWNQEYVSMYGKRHPIPRLTAWYGDAGARYTYSKILNEPLTWTKILLELKTAAEQVAGETFNSVLLNLYRSGEDSVAWHADDEPELGEYPTIASFSFGAERRFEFRSNSSAEEIVGLTLTHGSLIVMKGESQRAWKHRIPKQRNVRGERINLTFRRIGESPSPRKSLPRRS